MNKNHEQVIVSLTTWRARIHNIPVVLDSIFNQTVKPDTIIINLAYDEIVPHEVEEYINEHNIVVNRVEDTKVYKKFIPTLKKFPEACVINIDDDMIYPEGMIEDFLNQHRLYPDNPICGNHSFCFGIMCHCGEASLTKLSYFGDYLDTIDSDLIAHCPSSDFVYSYFAIKSGHPYIPSIGYYGTEFTPASQTNESWSKNVIGGRGIKDTYTYLVNRYGNIPDLFSSYFSKENCFIAKELFCGLTNEVRQSERLETESRIRRTKAYRLGHLLLKPFKLFK